MKISDNKTFGKGLNVIVASDKTTKPFMRGLKKSVRKYMRAIILDDSLGMSIKEIRILKRKRTNIIIHTHNDEIIDIADHLFGLTKKGIVELKK